MKKIQAIEFSILILTLASFLTGSLSIPAVHADKNEWGGGYWSCNPGDTHYTYTETFSLVADICGPIDFSTVGFFYEPDPHLAINNQPGVYFSYSLDCETESNGPHGVCQFGVGVWVNLTKPNPWDNSTDASGEICLVLGDWGENNAGYGVSSAYNMTDGNKTWPVLWEKIGYDDLEWSGFIPLDRYLGEYYETWGYPNGIDSVTWFVEGRNFTATASACISDLIDYSDYSAHEVLLPFAHSMECYWLTVQAYDDFYLDELYPDVYVDSSYAGITAPISIQVPEGYRYVGVTNYVWNQNQQFGDYFDHFSPGYWSQNPSNIPITGDTEITAWYMQEGK
jgi:hypothetical protein